MRRGWAASTIHTILVNEKYLGRWIWNKTTFVKDPETGKRTPVARPQDDWVVEERPDLAIVDGVWKRVQARLETVRTAYGARENQKRPRGQAPEVYSPHPLSGLIRREICGARITIQTSQRKKNDVVYRYGRYRCSFHVTKGPAVCSNSMSIRQDVLDGRLLDKFNGALTSEMIDYLVTATNQVLQQLRGATLQEIETLTAERQVVERELSNLVEFVIKGVLSSSRLREECAGARCARFGGSLTAERPGSAAASLLRATTHAGSDAWQPGEAHRGPPGGRHRATVATVPPRSA
jgi:hypothetical protein